MAGPPPTVGSKAERPNTVGCRLSDEEWKKSLENMEESGEEEEVSEYSDCPPDESIDATAEFEKEMEEQRIADEKNGHFLDVSDQNLSMSDQLAAPANKSPTSVRDRVAAPSRVSLATHRAKALSRKNLDEIRTEGGNARNRVISGTSDCSKPSHIQIQNDVGRFDFGRLHAENKERIMETRGGADLILSRSDIREFENEVTADKNKFAPLFGDSIDGKVGSINMEMIENCGTNMGTHGVNILDSDIEVAAASSQDMSIINGSGFE